MGIKKLEYEVRFLTPAFLGNAEQNGQWRTPPFKALLRHWWRVAYAADHGFEVDIERMRREEGVLFGNAWLSKPDNPKKPDYSKSLVRLRISCWDKGKLRTWQGLEQDSVQHPETQRTNYRVGPHAYLGYGPLDARGGTRMAKERKSAINVGESAVLSLAYRSYHQCSEIQQILTDNLDRIPVSFWLMDRYGSVGGRSRNGWGSIALTSHGDLRLSEFNAAKFSRHWQEALELDWPHALGRDDSGLLVWETRTLNDWKTLMRELAVIKIGLRTQFVFPNERSTHRDIEPRHYLSYPITNHRTNRWKGDMRLPNSLRFKVRETPEGELKGVIFHVPCKPPEKVKQNQEMLLKTWQAVHELLDELSLPATSRTYRMITNNQRRDYLKESLERVNLCRGAE